MCFFIMRGQERHEQHFMVPYHAFNIDICTMIDEQLNNFQIAIIACSMQWSQSTLHEYSIIDTILISQSEKLAYDSFLRVHSSSTLKK